MKVDMKKMFLMLLTCGMFTGVASARPADDLTSPAGVAVMKSGSTFKVFYKGANTAAVRISIYGDNRTLVFSEVVRNVESFVRPYNFSSLPEGNYTVEVNDGTSVKIEKLAYWKAKARFIHLNRIGETDKYILSVPNRGEDVLRIKIYNAAGDELYSQMEAISADFAKLYTLKGVSGKIFFEITDKTGTVRSITE
jgi:hypothetical protein